MVIYPLEMVIYPLKIVIFPLNMVILHSYVNVYQRLIWVTPVFVPETMRTSLATGRWGTDPSAGPEASAAQVLNSLAMAPVDIRGYVEIQKYVQKHQGVK